MADVSIVLIHPIRWQNELINYKSGEYIHQTFLSSSKIDKPQSVTLSKTVNPHFPTLSNTEKTQSINFGFWPNLEGSSGWQRVNKGCTHGELSEIDTSRIW